MMYYTVVYSIVPTVPTYVCRERVCGGEIEIEINQPMYSTYRTYLLYLLYILYSMEEEEEERNAGRQAGSSDSAPIGR